MRMKLTSLGLLTSGWLLACSGDGKSDGKMHVERPATDADAGDAAVDAGSVPKPPRTCDVAETPGNDCSDAVACRNAPECGLDAASCCVPGLNIPKVVCEPDLSCTEGSRAGCDGPEDCGGRICCVDIVAGKTACADSCDGTILCHTTLDCPLGKECRQGMQFTWWGVCG